MLQPDVALIKLPACKYVRQVVRQSKSSFLWGMRVLPRKRRQALYAVYAFSRVVDDIADGAGPLAQKRAALDRWRSEVDRIYSDCPVHPIGQALLEPVARFELPRAEFMALIDGMETDAAAMVRISTLDELLLYCRRVAGSVGVLSVHVFGAKQPQGMKMAIQLGQAFQLTNILSDIAEDARLDRVYLPGALLRKYNVPDAPLPALLQHPNVANVCQELAALAHASYARAEAFIRQLNWLRMRPPVLMKAVYKPMLDRLDRRGWTRLGESVRLGSLEKIWHVLSRSLSAA
ncbi:MAG: presqualene diphosphate synthase HpnD [Bacteroidota bacterium]|nr:presqualene diphosphate synthase HpnD [Bacteroidota bacterium]